MSNKIGHIIEKDMAEIQLVRIKSLYGEARGYLDAIKKGSGASGPYTVPRSIVDNFNLIVDEVSRISDTDYSRSKIPEHELRQIMSFRLVEPLVSGFVTRLEQEYGFGQENHTQPGIVIFNKNESEISLKINYTINDLISKIDNDEGKTKLSELKNELEKPQRNWETIKGILIWILNFSKDLFLEVLPIILQKKL